MIWVRAGLRLSRVRTYRDVAMACTHLSEAVGLFNQCREMYEKELRNTLKELDRIKEDYVRKGKVRVALVESVDA